MHDAPAKDVRPPLTIGSGPRERSLGSVRAPSLAIALALACGTSLVLGTIRLGSPSLWIDESYTVRAVGRSFPELWE